MELKREQTIKALECCTANDADCENCPLVDEKHCGIMLLKNASALIKELTEESRIANGEAYAYKLHCNRLEQQVKSLSELLDKAYDTIAEGDA